MDCHERENDGSPSEPSRWREAGIWLLGVVAVLVVGFALEDEVGIPFATTLRVACAAICLFFIYKLRLEYAGERWPLISFWVALLVNVAIFFTPLVDRPPSRGELMLFALPDAVVVLTARIVTYRVVDVHQRANRQTMILGLVVASVFCLGVLGSTLMEPRTANGSSFSD
jgi:hypothetical protein